MRVLQLQSDHNFCSLNISLGYNHDKTIKSTTITTVYDLSFYSMQNVSCLMTVWELDQNTATVGIFLLLSHNLYPLNIIRDDYSPVKGYLHVQVPSQFLTMY